MIDSEADSARARAALELDDIRMQTHRARAELDQVRKELSGTRTQLSLIQAEHLVEANEQLVASALLAQATARRYEQTLEQMSRATELDVLTGLPNRTLLLDRFAHAIAQARRDRRRLALLFLDLDNFKHINDTLGHAVGDAALKITAGCLSTSVREADTVSRYGGDEFLVLLGNVAEPADAVRVADKVIAALGMPSRVGDHAFRLTASIGISIYPEHGDDPGALIHKADAAMYLAKKHGIGRFVFGEAEEPGPQGPKPPLL